MTTAQLYLASLDYTLRRHPLSKMAIAQGVPWQNLLPDLSAADEKLLQHATDLVANGASFSETQAQAGLVSIFSRLGKDARPPQYVPASSTNLLGFLPVLSTPEVRIPNPDFKNLPTHKDPGHAAEQLLFFIEKHTSTIQSGYESTVPLYDFARLHAATAICLANATPEKPPLLLVSGGVSGIQKYLFDVLSRKASKNLKGRSFFLQLLVDTVVLEIQELLGVFRTNVVYATGSKFLLLVPNTDQNHELLTAFRKNFAQRLFADFRTRLYLELEWTETPDLKPATLRAAFTQLNTRLNQQNKHRFADTLLASKEQGILTSAQNETFSGYDFFFQGEEISGEEERDAITNEEIWGDDKVLLEQDEPDSWVKPLTFKQVQLGGLLQQTDALFVSKSAGLSEESHRFQIAGSPYHFYLIKQHEFRKFANTAGWLYQFGFGLSPIPGIEAVQGFLLYAGNKVPVYSDDSPPGTPSDLRHRKGDPIVFEDLADDGRSRFKRLGVLRMDVDRLGQTFNNLFNPDENPHFPTSFAAYAAMSRSLDYFFKGCLNELWANDDACRQHVQIIYAGGDDLFIVGKWNVVIDLAKTIREKFLQWSCGALSLSGGITLVTPKFPIIKAAESAGEMEDLAKDYTTGDGRSKNAFTLFGSPLRWDTEFAEVERLKNQLAALVTNGALPRGFFSKIQGLYDQSRFQIMHERTELWRWRIAYDFSRMKDRSRKDPALQQFLDALLVSIITNRSATIVCDKQTYDYFTLLFLATQWADLDSRTKSSTE